MAEESEEHAAEAEFIDISIEQDGSLLKKILKEGDPERGTPAKTDDVLIHYEARLHADGTKFDASMDRGFKQFQFQVGCDAHDGSTKYDITRAFDVGVQTMHQREKCILLAQPNYGYGKAGWQPKSAKQRCVEIPSNAVLEFEVELFAWQKHDWDPDEMESDAERSAYAQKHKEEGNEQIKAGEWAAALKKYGVGIKFMEFNGGARESSGDSQEDGFRLSDIGDGAKLNAEDRKLYIALLSNSAMAILKMKDGLPSAAIQLCDKALAVDPSNIKVLYRRGQAQMERGDWDLVIEGMDRILGFDPGNAEAQKMRQGAVTKKEASKKQQKNVYGKMFGGK